MLKTARSLLAVAVTLGALTFTMQAADTFSGSGNTIFVMTNNNTRNEVLAYQRTSDEKLVFKGHFATGGRGSGGTTDPLQSQGSLILSQNHHLLFAINAGSGTISSFHLLAGFPILIDQESTGGAFPVAAAEHGGTVYVLNAGGNGAIVAFRADDLGRLRQIPNSPVYLPGTNSGASSIYISHDGSTLFVIEKASNNIDVFPIRADGTLGGVVTNHSVTPGVFSTVFTPGGKLIVAENQPGGNDVSTISSYTINPNGTLTAITQSIPTFGDGACWNTITPNGNFVYVDNAATSTIAGFSVDANGILAPIGGTIVRTYSQGSTDLDMSITGDGKYVYTLNSGTGSIGVNGINADGTLNNLGEVDGLPKTAGFNGMAAL